MMSVDPPAAWLAEQFTYGEAEEPRPYNPTPFLVRVRLRLKIGCRLGRDLELNFIGFKKKSVDKPFLRIPET